VTLPIKIAGEKVVVGRATAQRKFDAGDRLMARLNENNNGTYKDKAKTIWRTKSTDRPTKFDIAHLFKSTRLQLSKQISSNTSPSRETALLCDGVILTVISAHSIVTSPQPSAGNDK
jgi:hypothetical protein